MKHVRTTRLFLSAILAVASPCFASADDLILTKRAFVATTEAGAEAVLDELLGVEDLFGRRREERWGPRSLDLDLLLYDELIVDEPDLILPRPEILEYAFVLRPLAEIAADSRHPVSGQSYAALWDRFDAASQPMWPLEQ